MSDEYDWAEDDRAMFEKMVKGHKPEDHRNKRMKMRVSGRSVFLEQQLRARPPKKRRRRRPI